MTDTERERLRERERERETAGERERERETAGERERDCGRERERERERGGKRRIKHCVRWRTAVSGQTTATIPSCSDDKGVARLERLQRGVEDPGVQIERRKVRSIRHL